MSEKLLMPPHGIFTNYYNYEKSYERFATLFCEHSFQILNQDLNSSAIYSLTSPIAYIHSENLNDSFRYKKYHPFFYVNYIQFQPEGLWISLLERNMMYAIISVGPDNDLDYVNVIEPLFETYDPTNGTVSQGDIIRWSEIYNH
ncbi:MAG: hypothetical protein N2246_10425, partial [Candidatus Sumerlaeia bacterium]|nr:hypothetical protein [Candidatus Sumerlaeia bacterium]